MTHSEVEAIVAMLAWLVIVGFGLLLSVIHYVSLIANIFREIREVVK
jgi:hypothetical protein